VSDTRVPHEFLVYWSSNQLDVAGMMWFLLFLLEGGGEYVEDGSAWAVDGLWDRNRMGSLFLLVCGQLWGKMLENLCLLEEKLQAALPFISLKHGTYSMSPYIFQRPLHLLIQLMNRDAICSKAGRLACTDMVRIDGQTLLSNDFLTDI
jgi:hypothetical protein